jgi:hypothetical protein
MHFYSGTPMHLLSDVDKYMPGGAWDGQAKSAFRTVCSTRRTCRSSAPRRRRLTGAPVLRNVMA